MRYNYLNLNRRRVLMSNFNGWFYRLIIDTNIIDLSFTMPSFIDQKDANNNSIK